MEGQLYFQKPLKVNQPLGLLLISQFPVSQNCIFVQFSFRISNCINLSFKYLPCLGGGKESTASAICDVQDLFTILTISIVVTPWHPKNVPGPLQHAGWEMRLQKNSLKAEQYLVSLKRILAA